MSTTNDIYFDKWKQIEKKSDDCPHCGRCKHCGRPDNVPYYPVYPSYPQPGTWPNQPWMLPGQTWC